MGNLIKAEFRKITTTRIWWALAVPAVFLAVGWGWLSSDFFTDVSSSLNDFLDAANVDADLDKMSWASLALTRAMNFATLFPMVFGGLAVASEINRRTITTSFLTASTRSALLTAKALTYALWGLIFGVIVALSASLGVLIGAGSDILPTPGQWITILLTGILSCVLWTLLGMGLGALLGSPVATLLILLLYAGLVGPISELIIFGASAGTSNIPGFLPNGSANGLTGSTAAALLFDQAQDVLNQTNFSDDAVEAFDQGVRAAAGAPGAFSLWLSGLIFAVWTAIFFVSGMVRNNKRDIT
jgi:ABC-2 type transport system permease protein